jgi:hypothetical protein
MPSSVLASLWSIRDLSYEQWFHLAYYLLTMPILFNAICNKIDEYRWKRHLYKLYLKEEKLRKKRASAAAAAAANNAAMFSSDEEENGIDGDEESSSDEEDHKQVSDGNENQQQQQKQQQRWHEHERGNSAVLRERCEQQRNLQC